MVALIFIWYILFLYGDIQVDPGPKSRTSQDCSFYHWNFNSITACSFLEILFLILLYAIHKFDNFFLKLILIQAFIVITKICLSPDTLWLEWIIWKCQTWWNSNLPSKLTRPESFLNKCLNLQLIIGNEVCSFISLYRSQSQILEYSRGSLDAAFELTKAIKCSMFLKA